MVYFIQFKKKRQNEKAVRVNLTAVFRVIGIFQAWAVGPPNVRGITGPDPLTSLMCP